jgi:hypothetical protein
MEAAKPGRGETIAAIAGLALLVVMFFFPWFGVSTSGIPAAGELPSADAWQSFTLIDLFLFLTVLVAVGGAVLAAGSRSVNTPVATSAITCVFGILATLLILFRIAFPPELVSGGSGLGSLFDTSREVGVYLGLLASIAIVYGSWTAMKEEGAS